MLLLLLRISLVGLIWPSKSDSKCSTRPAPHKSATRRPKKPHIPLRGRFWSDFDPPLGPQGGGERTRFCIPCGLLGGPGGHKGPKTHPKDPRDPHWGRFGPILVDFSSTFRRLLNIFGSRFGRFSVDFSSFFQHLWVEVWSRSGRCSCFFCDMLCFLIVFLSTCRRFFNIFGSRFRRFFVVFSTYLGRGLERFGRFFY